MYIIYLKAGFVFPPLCLWSDVPNAYVKLIKEEKTWILYHSLHKTQLCIYTAQNMNYLRDGPQWPLRTMLSVLLIHFEHMHGGKTNKNCTKS